MFKNLFIAFLIVAVSCDTAVFLTPAFAPTAHQNEYYSVRYRVRGLDNPTFAFENLPKSLTSTTDGVISGIPTQAGSYSIVVKYKSGQVSGSKQTILKVLPDLAKTSFVVQATKTRIGLVIEYPDNLIFVVGQTIRIVLVASNGRGPLVWGFHDLPTSLKGSSSTGIIEGKMDKSGYFNFNVQVADSEGASAEAFLTVNIQPKTTLRTTEVVTVESSASSGYNIDAIEAQQVAADNELFTALDKVDTRKAIVNDVKGQVAVATLRVNNAQASLNAADAAYKNAILDKESAQERVRVTERTLNAAQQNLELALTEQNSASVRLAEARAAVEKAQARFNAAETSLEQAEDNLVEAKAAMQKCEQELRDAKTEREAAQKEFNRAFQDLEDARTQLEDAIARKEIADQIVKASQDALDLAQQARDDAEIDLNKADFSLDQAEKALDAALQKVAAIRVKFLAAKEQYATAKWNWEQAVNKLYVAQARKQSADRASAIALAEGSASDHNNVGGGVNTIGSSGSAFIGCQAANYPIVSGISQVVQIHNNGYRLASGHNVVYGSCSNASKCAVGDFAAYNGYMVNGVVNALRIERVLLS